MAITVLSRLDSVKYYADLLVLSKTKKFSERVSTLFSDEELIARIQDGLKSVERRWGYMVTEYGVHSRPWCEASTKHQAISDVLNCIALQAEVDEHDEIDEDDEESEGTRRRWRTVSRSDCDKSTLLDLAQKPTQFMWAWEVPVKQAKAKPVAEKVKSGRVAKKTLKVGKKGPIMAKGRRTSPRAGNKVSNVTVTKTEKADSPVQALTQD